MLKNFEGLTKNFKLKPQTFYIDNWIFRMHYRVTALIFFVACIMVTSQQYIGEHIKCISDKGVAEHVMNTFCFFTTTFTLIRDDNHDDDMVPYDGSEAHPGVGPYGQNSTQPITRHAYYQWVPFLLFGQAIMFMITHMIWKKFEGGRIRRLVQGLEFGAYALLDKDVTVKVKAESKTIPSKAKKDEAMRLVRKAFIERIVINRSWSLWLVFCEILNVLHVILQVFITNEFLGRKFLTLGAEVAEHGYENTASVLDEVFPKVTKCTFFKYGPSGSIQLHDAMCVMALNIINEKIYIILWYWFIVLFAFSCWAVMWRIVTFLLHAKSKKFNQLVFSNACPGRLNPWNLLSVTKRCNFTDWLFLVYLSKNMDGMVFKELFIGLAEELEEKKPLISIDSDEESGNGTMEKNEKFE